MRFEFRRCKKRQQQQTAQVGQPTAEMWDGGYSQLHTISTQSCTDMQGQTDICLQTYTHKHTHTRNVCDAHGDVQAHRRDMNI